jgi:hypothetical protein
MGPFLTCTEGWNVGNEENRPDSLDRTDLAPGVTLFHPELAACSEPPIF